MLAAEPTTQNPQLRTRLFVILTLLVVSLLYSQKEIKFMYFERASYDYADYLINSGDLSPDYVFHQPYELDSSFTFPEQTRAGRYFNSYWGHYYKDGKLSLQLQMSVEGKQDGNTDSRFGAVGGIHYVDQYITLANRTAVDENYKYDQYFAGDLSESSDWIYGRVNDAYIHLNFGPFEAFYGRMNRNWGPVNSKSLIMSNNPYSYDHFMFNYTNEYFKISMIVAQLENMDAFERGVPDSTIKAVKNARKYMVGHRLDIPILDNLQIAFTEMATYGGENRQFEFSFLNPMNFYYAIQRNDQRQMNGIWSFQAFWKPWKRWTVYGEFLLDDIIVNNDPGEDSRALYDDRLGLNLSIRNADLLPGLNWEVGYSKIWNRTYQSKNTYENYHYRELGLGYPCASCEEVNIDIAYWGFFPFYIKNEITFGQYGNVELTDQFPFIKEEFPVAPVTNNFINNFTLDYFLSPKFQFSARITYRENPDHYSNRFGERDTWVFSLTVRALLTAGFISK